MMKKPVTPILHVNEFATHFGSNGSQWWYAEYFPFKANIRQYGEGASFGWTLSFVGAHFWFKSGETKTWSEAFQQVADARRDALYKLREQLP